MMSKSMKITALLLAAMIAVSASAVAVPPVSAAENTTVVSEDNVSGDFKYDVLSDGTVSISKYTGKAENLVIPSTLGGKKVTEIGSSAFLECFSLKSVTIPNSVTKIGVSAFHRCTFLESVTVPKSVKEIGDYAFFNCIGLKSVTFANGVTKIGSSAFYRCPYLKSVTIPSSVTYVGDGAFGNCDSLESINVSEQNKSYSSKDGVLFNKSKTELICCPGMKSGAYAIPSGVTKIKDRAFSNCALLKNVTVPNSVTEIGNNVFQGCTSLEGISVSEQNKNYYSKDGVLFNKSKTALICCPVGKSGTYAIPNGVAEIGDGAFFECKSLKSVTIPSSVTKIGDSAFGYCALLKNVTISNGVKEIGFAAFSDCESLESITIPNSVTLIEDFAFSGCASLKSITIPNSVKSIDYCVFEECPSLESINVSEQNENYSSIDGVLFDKNKTTLIFYPEGKSGAYTIPNSVVLIGDYAFRYCNKLTSVTFSNSVKSIEYGAFAGCNSLKSISIPNSVTEIERYALGYENESKKIDDFTIYGTKGSTSERYAENNSIRFVENISLVTVSLANTSYTYTGKAITPTVTVKDGSTTLKNGTDYTVSYKSNTNIGTATVTITGKGNYTGTKTATFKIVAPTVAKPTNLKSTQSASAVKLTWNKASGVDSYGVYVYDTKAGKYKGLATVTGTSYTVKNLKAGTTYKFAVRSNKKVGGTTFHSSNAVGTVNTKFAKVKSLKAAQSTSAVKLSWSKVSGATSYDVYQKIGGKWKKVAATKSTSYTVKKLKAGTVYNFAVRANKVVGKTTYYGEFAFITTATKTATPTMSVKAAGSRRATVTWKKVSGATGYQIYMSTKKTSGYKKVATVSPSKKASYTKTGLTKGKTYYVRVRTYKTVGGQTIYSGYQTKSVKIK